MDERQFELNDYAPSSRGPTPLFVDTSAFRAYFDADTEEHAITRDFFCSIAGENPRFPYRPLYTNSYVVDEVATLLQSARSHGVAADALEHVFMLADDGLLTILRESDEAFERTKEAFYRYDDHEISFTDQMIAVQANRHDIDHVLTYDGDFRTLGLTVIPHSRR